MERITKAMLETRVKNLNEILPINKKCFALDIAYGGIRLVLRENSNGGVDGITKRGTTREIYDIIDGMLYFLRLQQDNERI
jgi:ATP-dependent DNA ligase